METSGRELEHYRCTFAVPCAGLLLYSICHGAFGDILKSAEETAPDSETDGAHKDKEDYLSTKEGVHKLAQEMGISLEEATRAAYSSKGIRPPRRPINIEHLNELIPGMRSVSLRARVITKHTAERQSGEGTYCYGLLGDSTTTVNFSSWCDFPFERGEGLIAENVSVREWNDRLEIVINDFSTLLKLEQVSDLLPSFEDGIPASIAELNEDSSNVDMEGRIIVLRSSTVKVKGVEREIRKGVIADRTGRIDFTCWGPVDLIEDVCYRICGGYLRPFRGGLCLNFDAGAIIRQIPDDNLPPKEELLKPVKSRIARIADGRSSGPETLRGTFVDVRPGSGIYRKCTECGRRVIKGQCTVHGRNEGEEDLRIKGVFDDGSGTAIASADRHLSEILLGRSMTDLMEEVRKTMDPEILEEEIRSILVGRQWTLIGDPMVDEYGVTIGLREITGGWEPDELIDEVTSLMEAIA